MQKEQLQQNVKDKVRVFEDGGIRLLKRGQKGVVHAIFSRFGLVLVLLLLQAFALFSLLQWFQICKGKRRRTTAPAECICLF